MTAQQQTAALIAATQAVWASAELSLRIGQRVRHRDHAGRRVTGVINSLQVEEEKGLTASVILDEPIIIPARGEGDREICIHWQTCAAHEFAPFDDRDELIAEMLKALVAMEREFGRTYLKGSSSGVDQARAAIHKATGPAA